jgi:hypothetical protein
LTSTAREVELLKSREETKTLEEEKHRTGRQQTEKDSLKYSNLIMIYLKAQTKEVLNRCLFNRWFKGNIMQMIMIC